MWRERAAVSYIHPRNRCLTFYTNDRRNYRKFIVTPYERLNSRRTDTLLALWSGAALTQQTCEAYLLSPKGPTEHYKKTNMAGNSMHVWFSP